MPAHSVEWKTDPLVVSVDETAWKKINDEAHKMSHATFQHTTDTLRAAEDYTKNFQVLRVELTIVDSMLFKGSEVDEVTKRFLRLNQLFGAVQDEVGSSRLAGILVLTEVIDRETSSGTSWTITRFWPGATLRKVCGRSTSRSSLSKQLPFRRHQTRSLHRPVWPRHVQHHRIT